MRYAPTVFCLIVGWGGDFFPCSLTWRAYAIRPYTCSLNHWVERRFLCAPTVLAIYRKQDGCIDSWNEVAFLNNKILRDLNISR